MLKKYFFQSNRNKDAFCGARAFNFAEKLDKIGPKPFGSINNEEHAVNLILNEIKKINTTANKNQKLELKHLVTANYSYNEISAANLQNIVVKLIGQDKRNSVLINCNYNTEPGSSLGNGVNCAVMLETIRVLSSQPEKQDLTIIFHFNGAKVNQLSLKYWVII